MHVRLYREALCGTGRPAARKTLWEIARSGTTCSVGLTYCIVCGACGNHIVYTMTLKYSIMYVYTVLYRMVPSVIHVQIFAMFT